ncbi:hypothetical protein F2Q68_00044255 [Brassica cretica]|uniref:Uncharacterized protein n=1 Tax=Brassica cretica TaxID=69181 RepID=A0A8S9LMB5_BRACR|nr:hypothetical protein F2Q68_00044255 [Brassica cretica]
MTLSVPDITPAAMQKVKDTKFTECAQYMEHACVPNGLAHNLELEMCVGGLETSPQGVTADVAEVKQDVSEMKQDMVTTRAEINQLLQTLFPQQKPTGQTYTQPQTPTTPPNPVNGI